MKIVAASSVLARRKIASGGAARGRTERHALLLEVVTDGGIRGRGEAAPLPGFADDSLDAVQRDLAGFRARARFDVARDGDPVDAIAPHLTNVTSPSARFAIETALLDARANAAGVSLATLLGVHEERPLSCAVLVDNPAQARSAVLDGARVLKVKAGPAGDIARIRAIHRAAPEAVLRIDANRSWAAEHAPAYLAALVGLPIDFVEEPTADTCALLARSPVPLALDETLAAPFDLAAALALPGLAALVIKPTVVGGVAATRALVEEARRAGKRAVITHALEGPIGHVACVAIALAYGAPDETHGLAPHAGLVGDSVERPPRARLVHAEHELEHQHQHGHGADQHARVLVATSTPETVRAIWSALDTHSPLALLHPQLPPEEIARQRRLVETTPVPPGTAFVLFTSGSTGQARGVVLPRSAIDAAAATAQTQLDLGPDDTWLLALPLAHAGGLSIVVRCLAARATVRMQHDKETLGTIASLVPTQLAQLLDDPAWRPPSTLRAVLLGGAASSPALLARAAERGVPFLTSYGLTESFGQIATAPLGHAGDPHAPLVPLPGVEITAGTREEPAPIVVRSPTLATMYLGGATIAPAFTTADLGFLEDGALHIVGRSDDVIITGGENVHPIAVEAVLSQTPGIVAAVAFGVADERWGQIVGAALVVAARFDRAAAEAHWRAHLPRFAVPRTLAVVDALPLLANGKVDRRAAARLARTL